MTLQGVDRFRVSASIIDETDAAIQRAGGDGFEAFVLWTGTVADSVFEVGTLHLPKQTSYRLEDGLCVRIGGEELHRLNRWLLSAGEILGIQVHSHPQDAYHSETDNAYPVVTLLGGLSIVVADFGRKGLLDRSTAMFRLGTQGWTDVPRSVAAAMIEVGS